MMSSDTGSVPLKWIALQGVADFCALCFFAKVVGTDPISFLQTTEAKYIIAGPAFLMFGVVGNRLRKEEPPGFEEDPIVRWLGGADTVRAFRESLVENARVSRLDDDSP